MPEERGLPTPIRTLTSMRTAALARASPMADLRDHLRNPSKALGFEVGAQAVERGRLAQPARVIHIRLLFGWDNGTDTRDGGALLIPLLGAYELTSTGWSVGSSTSTSVPR